LIRGSFTLMPRSGVLRSPDTRSCIALAYWTGVQTLPPGRLFSSWVHQDHRYEMVDARVWRQVEDEARESPVTLPEFHLRSGSGGSQKLFSPLIEGVTGMFTTNTGSGEKLVAHLYVLRATTMSSSLVVRANIVLGTPPRNGCRHAVEMVVL
jgi:hypothetical protein